ncbi:MAG: hypothetical protein HY800_05485, partial [Ignavibacteriales bacterium]|nr:hypothetical protein [Ignavibacteriales bacterium]
MLRFSSTVHLFYSILLFCLVSTSSSQEIDDLKKITDDIENKYTTIGSIGLTITNFGTIGTRNYFWPDQPSCEYPRGSRIEHIYQGGIWVGAIRGDQILVSTGASDRTTRSSLQHLIDGYEFNSALGDSILELSTLTDERPLTSQFSPIAISHQDFIADYTDTLTRVPS